MANNKRTIVYNSRANMYRISRINSELSKKYDENKENAALEEINAAISFLHQDNVLLKNSSKVYLNKNASQWKINKDSGNQDKVIEEIQKLTNLGGGGINVFNILGNKSNTAKEMLDLSIKNINISINRQNGSANESIKTWKEAYKNYKGIWNSGGNLAVWDLETFGGKNAEGIWNPYFITEFAMQKYKKGTNGKIVDQVDSKSIFMGWDKETSNSVVPRIKEAIKNGTLDSNEELRVTAMRMASYAHDDFKYTKTAEGYFTVTNFPKEIGNSYKDIDVIEKADKLLSKVYKETKVDADTGIKMDVLTMVKTMGQTMNEILENKTMLTGYNSTLFDEQVFNSVLYNLSKKYSNIYEILGHSGFNIPSQNNIDILGGAKLYTDIMGVSNLYNGKLTPDIQKVRGQEYLLQAHYGNLFEELGLKPHRAEDDVKGLSLFFTHNSELFGNKSLVDAINEGISGAKTTVTGVNPNSTILQSKRRIAQPWGGKNFLNFAQSKSTGAVYTADNHVIDFSDPSVNGVGGVVKEDFSAGYGINQDAFYHVNTVREIDLNDEIRSAISELSPEYANGKLFHVQLEMETTADSEYSRLNDIVQNLFFKSQKEMEAFLSGNFDAVAEKDKNGIIKINKNSYDRFDRKEMVIDEHTNKLVAKNLNKGLSDQQIYEEAIRNSNEKILVSRAKNATFKDKPYSRVKRVLELKDELNEILGYDTSKGYTIKGQELQFLMSDKIDMNNLPGMLTPESVEKAREVIFDKLHYTKNNEKRVLRSTIDNTAMGIDMVSQNENFYRELVKQLDNNEKFKSAPQAVKEYYFKRVLEDSRLIAATGVYDSMKGNTSDYIDMAALGNKRLKTTKKQLKNTYELNISKLDKNTKDIHFVGTSDNLNTENILKVKLDNQNSPYEIIRKATQTKFGKDKANEAVYQRDAMLDLLKIAQEDEDLSKTKSFKSFNKRHKWNNKSKRFKNEDNIHPYELAETLIRGMKQVKKVDITKGIVNPERMFMQTIEEMPEMLEIFNSGFMPEIIGSVIDSNVNNTTIKVMDHNLQTAKDIAKTIMNDIFFVKEENVKGDYVKEILSKNAYEDLNAYVTDIVNAASHIGATISGQENGNLLLMHNGNAQEILLPKIKVDEPSGTMYAELGSMKIQINNVLDFARDGKTVKGDVASSLNIMNKYKISNRVESNVKSGKDGFEALIQAINGRNKALRQQSTINGFSGNDIDSNYGVDTSNIKNVLVDLFDKDSPLGNLLNNVEFADKEFVEKMRKNPAIARAKKTGKNIESLDAGTVRDMIKNMNAIIEKIAKDGNISVDFKKLMDTFGYTGYQTKTSSLIGYSKYRPGNSAFYVFDNIQRPPVLQSGNAYHINEDTIKPKKTNIKAKSTITSDFIEKRNVRDYHGVNKTVTDIMMDTTYISNKGLDVLLDTHYTDIISDNKTDIAIKKKEANIYTWLKENISVFEQERIMDARAHEEALGLKTAATQKLSSTFDVKNLLDGLEGEELKKQQKAILKTKGSFSLNEDGSITYKSANGMILQRGQSAIKWKGFADKNEGFASKVRDGIFNYNFYNADGLKVTDEELNKLIANLDLSNIMEQNLSEAETFSIVADKLKKKYNIDGRYAIEDMSAIGYIKTLTPAEKGMSHILYLETASQNEQVGKFFKNLGKDQLIKGKVLTNEAINAIFFEDEEKSLKALEGANIKDLAHLKELIEEERLSASEFLYGKILKNKTTLLVNDALGDHGNTGQFYEGMLSKAVDVLGKEYGSHDEAVKFIADLLNNDAEAQFMQTYDKTKGIETSSPVKFTALEGGRLSVSDDLYDVSKTASLDSDKFKYFMKKVDDQLKNTEESDRLITKDVYVYNADGTYKKVNELLGSHQVVEQDIEVDGEKIKGARVVVGTNNREAVKYVRDSETQSGVTAEQFEMLNTKRELQKERIAIKNELAKTDDVAVRSSLEQRLLKINAQIDDIDIADGTMKYMKFGDQELSILERIAVTEGSAERMQKVLNKDESIAETLIKTEAFKNIIEKTEDGKYKLKEEFIGEKGFSGLLDSLLSEQYYKSNKEDLLTEEMVNTKEFSHLKNIFENAKAKNIDIGVDSAEKVLLTQKAMLASKFNRRVGVTVDDLSKEGFELMNIGEVNFGVDNLVEKNIVVDLGKDFGPENRFIAVPGLGMKMADEEIRSAGHKELAKLKYAIEDFNSFGGNKDADGYDAAFNRVINARENAQKVISQSIFGKHGLLHKQKGIEIQMSAQRLKLSSAIGANFSDELIAAAKENGIELDNYAHFTKKAQIMGESIDAWEKKGVHFDYEFVSREKLKDEGYFDKKTLEKFGFTKESEMEEFLSVHGTLGINDRYPNNKSESLYPVRRFLGEGLANNQRKISMSAMMKVNGDNDGDLMSSFRVELKDGGESIDYARFLRARQTGNFEGISQKIIDEFEKQERALVHIATVENDAWYDKAIKILNKDFAKNSNLSNLENKVLIPGGESILGKMMFTVDSSMPSQKEWETVHQSIGNLLKVASDVTGDEAFNVNINEVKSSAELLDKALVAVKDNVSKEDFSKFENAAIRKVAIDKHSQEVMAKTGLAATGGINLAINAVKLSTVFSNTDDPNKKNLNRLVWEALDVAEEGAISAKKLKGGGYDESRITEFETAIREIFNSNRKGPVKQESLDKLETWFDNYGGDIFENAYTQFGTQILKPESIEKIQGTSDEVAQGAILMKKAFIEEIQKAANDPVTKAYKASLEAAGRNSARTERLWENGEVSIAGSKADTFASRQQAVLGYTDDESLIYAEEIKQQREQSKINAEKAKEQLRGGKKATGRTDGDIGGKTTYTEDMNKNIEGMLEETVKKNKKTVLNDVDDVAKHAKIGSVGKMAIALGTGLLIGGYASGNPLNDKQAQQVADEQQQQTPPMSIPQFMDQGGYVTGNTQRGYIINIKADTKKGRKYMENIMRKTAEATVGGSVNVNMTLKNKKDGYVTDSDIENYLNRHF